MLEDGCDIQKNERISRGKLREHTLSKIKQIHDYLKWIVVTCNYNERTAHDSAIRFSHYVPFRLLLYFGTIYEGVVCQCLNYLGSINSHCTVSELGMHF